MFSQSKNTWFKEVAFLDLCTEPNWINPRVVQKHQVAMQAINGGGDEYQGIGGPFTPRYQVYLKWQSLKTKKLLSAIFNVGSEGIPDVLIGRDLILKQVLLIPNPAPNALVYLPLNLGLSGI